MKITNLKINGLKAPLGFSFPYVTVSWNVDETSSKHQKETSVKIASDAGFKNILACKEGVLNAAGETLDITLSPRTEYFVKVAVTGDAGDSAEAVTTFETGKMSEPWAAKWVGLAAEDSYHPVFKKNIALKGNVSRARLYITAVGVYEAFINGTKIGEDCLAPFFNDYNCAIQVETYDVTELLAAESLFTVMTGNGWYKGRLGYNGDVSIYGDKFGCLAELHIEYADGSSEIISTDESWTYEKSQITESDIYDGETIDRTVEPGCEKPVVLLPEMEKKTLTDRFSPAVKHMEELEVKEILHTPAGETVLDFGQNFSGIIKFHAAFPAGTEVLFEYGEVLQQDNFYRDNYRTAKAQIKYISNGTEEWAWPRFTFCGFRYVRVTGWPGEIKKEDFKGVAIYSEMDRTGYLETGNEKVNKLISNALWGLKSNFLDMPTDCPQRDERLGWTGDAQVFTPTASFFMDTRAFYRKFIWDMRNDQVLRGGAIANYLPNIFAEPGGSSVWGDAGVFIPWELYNIFGDEAALKDSYPMMKDWVEWIRREDRARGEKFVFDFHFTFGDWLAMDGPTEQSFKGNTDDAYVSTVYYYASTSRLASAAEILGYADEAAEYRTLAEHIKEALLNEYFTPSGRLAMDTQTGYVIALYFGVWREKDALIKGLKERLKKDCYRIRCGFAGAPLICEVLAENGMEDLAFRLFLNEESPSWLHCVNLGATTIWERWNSLLDDGSISGTGMNSLNHYAYGSVIHYGVKYIAGMDIAEKGCKSVHFEPQFDGRLKNVSLCYRSAAGVYGFSWAVNPDGTITVKCAVPFDGEAELVLPGCETEILSAGQYEKTFKPDRDYNHPYSWNTILGELKDDERAMTILREKLPVAFGLAMSGDRENLSQSIAELKFMPWMGVDPEIVDNVAAEIFNLTLA
ncbi:MAG: family 78 glycoside hydrolase catalytic domain [Parasporobacterium sp.]|nr:family 78 glycoside hydrolase catalytic domain [Parasporobacterium sp.]